MTNHPDDGRLQSYLDGELSFDDAEAVDRHLLRCTPCRERAEEFRGREARARVALALLDRDVDADAALWRVRQARARRRSSAQRHRLAAAAVVVLLLGAGAAAAMPGSPIRGWLWGPEEPVRVETTAAEARGAALSFQLRDEEGRVRVEVPAAARAMELVVDDRTRLRIRDGVLELDGTPADPAALAGDDGWFLLPPAPDGEARGSPGGDEPEAA